MPDRPDPDADIEQLLRNQPQRVVNVDVERLDVDRPELTPHEQLSILGGKALV